MNGQMLDKILATFMDNGREIKFNLRADQVPEDCPVKLISNNYDRVFMNFVKNVGADIPLFLEFTATKIDKLVLKNNQAKVSVDFLIKYYGNYTDGNIKYLGTFNFTNTSVEFKVRASQTTLFADFIAVNVDAVAVNEIFYNPGALFDISLLNSYFSMLLTSAIPFSNAWFTAEYNFSLPKTIMEIFKAENY